MSKYTIQQVNGGGEWTSKASKPTEKSAERAASELEAAHRKAYGQHLTHIATGRSVGTCRIVDAAGTVIDRSLIGV